MLLRWDWVNFIGVKQLAWLIGVYETGWDWVNFIGVKQHISYDDVLNQVGIG